MTHAQHANALTECQRIAGSLPPLVARGKLYRIALLAVAAAHDHYRRGDSHAAELCLSLANDVDTIRQSL